MSSACFLGLVRPAHGSRHGLVAGPRGPQPISRTYDSLPLGEVHRLREPRDHGEKTLTASSWSRHPGPNRTR